MGNEKDTLKSLADEARSKLQKQLDEGKDIYSEMREHDTDEPLKDLPQQPIMTEDRDIPKLKNMPDEADLEELHNEPIMSYDDAIFEGGPTISKVESLKKLWDGYDVYATEIAGQYFIFRTINRFEYKQMVALKNTDPIQREEIICETCTLWPDNYNYKTMAVAKAGIPSTYSQIIMEKSGFTKEYTIQVI